MHSTVIKLIKILLLSVMFTVLSACSGGGSDGSSSGGGNSGGTDNSGSSGTVLSIPLPTSINIDENTERVTEISLVGGDPLTATLSLSGDDASLFEIVDATRLDSGGDTINVKEIHFVTAPDFETTLDADNNNIYQLSLTATEDSQTASLDISVNVSNENDNSPVFTLSSTAINVNENEQVILTLTATDADNDNLIYIINGGDDSTHFGISGDQLGFRSSSIPNFEDPQDDDMNNIYEVAVTVSDGNVNITESLQITVDNVDEVPTFTSAALINVQEGVQNVVTVTFEDPDDGSGSIVTSNLSIVDDSANTDSELFVLSGADLQFISAPDFETPNANDGSNNYRLTLSYSESEQTTTQDVIVVVTNVNEHPPVFDMLTDAVTVGENAGDSSNPIFSSFNVTVSDADGDTVFLSIGSPFNSLFEISGSRILYSENGGLPDFEELVSQYGSEPSVGYTSGDSSISIPLTISATDGVFSASSNAVYTITVVDLDDLAIMDFTVGGDVTVVDGVFQIDENFSGVFGTVSITDIDNFVDPDIGAFTVDLNTVEIIAASGGSTVVGDDETFLAFEFDKSSGELRVPSGFVFDFEDPQGFAGTNSYIVDLQASYTNTDDEVVALSSILRVGFTVIDTNDNPPDFLGATEISSTLLKKEFRTTWNVLDGALQTLNLAATDIDNGDVVTLCLSGNGADESFFSVDGNVLSVKTPLDFELPADNGGTANDNVYIVEVEASNGECPVTSSTTVHSTLEILATVEDANDLPVINTVDSLTVLENHHHVVRLDSTDQDGDQISFRLSGGADRSLFYLSHENDQTLRLVDTLDFESPSDANADGVYEVQVEAGDGTGQVQKDFMVTVQDQSNELDAFSVSAVSLPTDQAGVLKMDWQDTVSGITGYILAEIDNEGNNSSIAASAAVDRGYLYDVASMFLNNEDALYQITSQNGGDVSSYQAHIRDINVNDLIAYIKATDAVNNDLLGSGGLGLSEDGSTLVVGAPDTGDGKVYIFLRDNLSWTEQAILTAANAGAGDRFGASIALSADGNTLAVGADAEDGLANDQLDSGAVYIYVRDGGGVWSEQAQLRPEANASFGEPGYGNQVSLADNGDTLVVAAMNDDHSATGESASPGLIDQSTSVDNSGSVYTYSRSGNIWSLLSYLKAPNAESEDTYGASVAVSGDGLTLAVGSTGEDSIATGVGGNQSDNTVSNSGAVYVYQRASLSDLWGTAAYIKADNTGQDDSFGIALDLSQDGSLLAIGATGEDGEHAGSSDTSSSVYESGEGDGVSNSGAVYVFNDTGSWGQQAYVKSFSTGLDDSFGQSVSLSDDGSLLLIGSPQEDSNLFGYNAGNAIVNTNNTSENAGAAFLYRFDITSWQPETTIKAQITHSGDAFGTQVILSGDGTRSAATAPGDNGAGTGVAADISLQSGTDTGAVYWY